MRLSLVIDSPLLVSLICATGAHAAQRGVVNGLSITPTTAAAGATVSATVSGVNPCGAVMVDWGDGSGAVTHPISELPVTKTHTYNAAGTYNVTARAMGNCDGEATGAVRINPAPPASVRRELTAFFVSSPGAKAEPITMSLRGEGICTIDLAFGDGNTQQVSVQLPHTLTHVYAEPRAYNVTAAAVSPCAGGRHTARLEITADPSSKSIARLVVTPNPARSQSRVSIAIEGRGTCPVTVRFGDGSEEAVEGALPIRVVHRYARPGRYEVFAWTTAPCTGDASGVVEIRR